MDRLRLPVDTVQTAVDNAERRAILSGRLDRANELYIAGSIPKDRYEREAAAVAAELDGLDAEDEMIAVPPIGPHDWDTSGARGPQPDTPRPLVPRRARGRYAARPCGVAQPGPVEPGVVILRPLAVVGSAARCPEPTCGAWIGRVRRDRRVTERHGQEPTPYVAETLILSTLWRPVNGAWRLGRHHGMDERTVTFRPLPIVCPKCHHKAAAPPLVSRLQPRPHTA